MYKCVEFPLKWEFVETLISSVKAVDSIIFKDQDIYWLLTNIDTSNNNEFCSELHIYHSKTLISKEWTPHKKNPVMIDASQGRNAGLINLNNINFRALQTQGFDKYGKSCGLSKIIKINESEYIEEKVFSITPHFFPKINGIHTINYKNGMLVFDYSKRKLKN